MVTKREWLMTQIGPDGKPLAKPGKGRLSRAAEAAIRDAEAKGMTFDEVTLERPNRYSAPKTVQTENVSEPVTVAKPESEPAPIVRVIPAAKPRVRPENEGWLISKPPVDKSHQKEHLIAFSNCAKCTQRIGFCNCANGPVGPKWVNGVEGEPLLLSKP